MKLEATGICLVFVHLSHAMGTFYAPRVLLLSKTGPTTKDQDDEREKREIYHW